MSDLNVKGSLCFFYEKEKNGLPYIFCLYSGFPTQNCVNFTQQIKKKMVMAIKIREKLVEY